MAVFFRRKENTEEVRTFALQEIELDASYEVEDFNGGKQVIPGKELANWTVHLDDPGSVSVIFYQKVK